MADPAPPAAEYFDQLAQISLDLKKTSIAHVEPVPLTSPLLPASWRLNSERQQNET
jgi:hypothetical protein